MDLDFTLGFYLTLIQVLKMFSAITLKTMGDVTITSWVPGYQSLQSIKPALKKFLLFFQQI